MRLIGYSERALALMKTRVSPHLVPILTQSPCCWLENSNAGTLLRTDLGDGVPSQNLPLCFARALLGHSWLPESDGYPSVQVARCQGRLYGSRGQGSKTQRIMGNQEPFVFPVQTQVGPAWPVVPLGSQHLALRMTASLFSTSRHGWCLTPIVLALGSSGRRIAETPRPAYRLCPQYDIVSNNKSHLPWAP